MDYRQTRRCDILGATIAWLLRRHKVDEVLANATVVVLRTQYANCVHEPKLIVLGRRGATKEDLERTIVMEKVSKTPI